VPEPGEIDLEDLQEAFSVEPVVSRSGGKQNVKSNAIVSLLDISG
jgi:hypothetical protein